jgi:hypothetical protein
MKPRRGKLLRLLGCVLTVTLAAGCGDACLDLASRVCGCLPDDGTRGACNARAKDSEANFPVTAQDQAFCQHQLDTGACDCRQLTTPEGKVGCGIAYVLPETSLEAPAQRQ